MRRVELKDLKEGDRVEVYEEGLGDKDTGTVKTIRRKIGKVDGRPVRGSEVLEVEITLDNRMPICISAEKANRYQIYKM